MKNRENYTWLAAGVIMISFSPIAVKLVKFAPTVSALYRTLYASIFLFLASLFNYGNEMRLGDKKWIMPVIVAGAFLGVDYVIWHKTIMYLGAGTATFLGNTQVIFVVLFAALVFKEKIPRAYYFLLFVIMSGMYMLVPSADTGVSKPLGYFLGILVGITYSGLLICIRIAKQRTSREYPEILSLCMIFSVSTAVIFLYNMMFERSFVLIWDPRSHLIMAAVALFAQTLGWILIKTNITRIPAHQGSLLLLLQPILAALWGTLIFSEAFGMMQFLGMAVALSGMIIYQMKYA